MYAAVLAIPAATPREAAVLAELFSQLNSVSEGRRERLILADGIVPNVIWLVLFAGAVVTLSFTLFFGSRNLGAQVLMTGLLAALIFMALFVAVEIDHPFTGPVSVSPQACTCSTCPEFPGRPAGPLPCACTGLVGSHT